MQTIKEMIFGERSEWLAVIVMAQLAARAGPSRHRRHRAGQHDTSAPSPSDKPRKEGPPQYRHTPKAPAALRAGAGAGCDGLPVLPGSAPQDR